MSGPREVHAPRGPEISCRGWQQEAALRMLMNNLDPEVAEDPDHLVVYGGSGRAARSWEAFDAIVESLRELGDDETLLVQSGKLVAAGSDRQFEPGRGVGQLGRISPPGGGRTDDVRPDDRRILDLHREPGDSPGDL